MTTMTALLDPPPRVPCPLCGTHMTADLVVCPRCDQLTNGLTPGRYVTAWAPGGLPITVTAAAISQWRAERAARVTSAGSVAPGHPTMPGAYITLVFAAAEPAELYRMAMLPPRPCPDCRGSGRWFDTTNGRPISDCPRCHGHKVVPSDLGIVRAGHVLPAGGRWLTPTEVIDNLPTIVGPAARGGDGA